LEEAGARPPEFFASEIGKQAPLFGLSLEAATAEGLSRYLAELDRWRRQTNLTGPLPAEDLVSHALESVFGGQLIAHGARVLDIGSGAGLPGIPIAISRTDLSVTLLEPRSKRADFLRHAVRSVPIANAKVRVERVERLTDPVFDLAVVRAVGNLAGLLGGAGFLGSKGHLLAWTTDPRGLAAQLAGTFILDAQRPIPGSERRAVVLMRRHF
jgi:16S rRNA (guanine527-N7)-methyltransferase